MVKNSAILDCDLKEHYHSDCDVKKTRLKHLEDIKLMSNVQGLEDVKGLEDIGLIDNSNPSVNEPVRNASKMPPASAQCRLVARCDTACVRSC